MHRAVGTSQQLAQITGYHDIALPITRLESFKRSFIPYSIKLWNMLPVQVRNAPSLSILKSHINKEKKEPYILYYYGSRWASIHHTRLRLGCSKLRSDLCFKLHVADDPACACGAPIEDAYHFFFVCPLYDDIRVDLINSVSSVTICNLTKLLFGDDLLDLNDNMVIFDAVHLFLNQSMRFS